MFDIKTHISINSQIDVLKNLFPYEILKIFIHHI